MAKHLISLLCFCAMLCANAHGQQQTPRTNAQRQTPKPKVLILGVYHFTSKANVYNLDIDDVMSEKRQREIADLLRRLGEFKPTKIVVEFPYGDAERLARYDKYLSGSYTLTANEIDQLGFRLAKSLGHKRIYAVDTKTPFDMEPVRKYAQANGQGERLKEAIASFETLNREMNDLLKRGTVRDMMRYINSERALQLNHQGYLLLNSIGRDPEYTGADLVSEWYKRNLRIFANLKRTINSPEDRVLVIYWQGHAPILRQLVKDSPDLELVEANDYL